MNGGRRSAGMAPLSPQQKWKAITIGTIVLLPAFWGTLIGLVSVASDDARRRQPRGVHRVRARARAVRLPRVGVRVGAPVRADGDGEGDVPLLADRHPSVRDRGGCGDRVGGGCGRGRDRGVAGERGGHVEDASARSARSRVCTRSCWRERRARSSSSACLRSPSRASASPTTSRSGGKRESWPRRPKAEWRGGRVRPLRRRRARVRHHAARHSAAVDQLPRDRRLLRADLEHRRRLLLLPGRPAAATDAPPVQQRAARRRGALPVRARRGQRRRLVAVVGAGAGRCRGLSVPARARVHGHRLVSGWDRGRDALLRAPRRVARGVACPSDESAR